MRTVDLLALDDFGAQSDTLWAREKLYQLVSYRMHQMHNNLPTVVTSNCPCKFQDHLASRASLQGDQHLPAELFPLAAHQIRHARLADAQPLCNTRHSPNT